MWKDLKNALGGIFPVDLIMRLLPIILLGMGGILYLSSYVLPDALGSWRKPFGELGLAILVSGVIGAMLKSLTYIGIFRTAMNDVVFGHDFLSVRKDLPLIWSRVTSAVCENKFPELAPHLDESVMNKYLPTRKDLYYSNYHRTCIVKWHDKARGVVSVEETIEIDINPSPGVANVAYSFSSVDDPDTPPDVQGIEIHEFSIKKKGEKPVDYKSAVKSEQIKDSKGGISTKTYYNIPLPSGNRYHVFRHITRTLCLDTDPVLNYTSEQFILGSTVEIKSPEKDLDVHFIDVGVADFEDMQGSKGWQVKKQLTGLMFPNQGYIMVIHRQPPPSGPAAVDGTGHAR